MAYFLGIDAGGTKTSFLLSDDRGRVQASYRTDGCRLLADTKDAFTAILREGAEAVCAQAGIQIGNIDFTGIGISGYGESKDGEADTLRCCEAVFGAGKVRCDCDCHIAWAGSLSMEAGINVISGTGANCYGVNAQGESARSNGWGALFDEGSCQWIGVCLVQYYTWQADGRTPRTLLYQRFRERYDIQDDMHFIGPLNHGFFNSAKETAALQRFCKELYDEGDSCAAELYVRAAKELARSAAAVARKLALPKGYAVSYSGGLFASGEAILTPFAEAVSTFGGMLTKPKYTPEEGAVLMAMRAKDPAIRFENLRFQAAQ